MPVKLQVKRSISMLMALFRVKLCYGIFEFLDGEIMAIWLVTWYNIQKISQFWLHIFAFHRHAKIQVIHSYIRDVSICDWKFFRIKQFGCFWAGFSYTKSKADHCLSQAVNWPICTLGTFFCRLVIFLISLWELNNTEAEARVSSSVSG